MTAPTRDRHAVTVLSAGRDHSRPLSLGGRSVLLRPRYAAACGLLLAAAVVAVGVAVCLGANAVALDRAVAAVLGHGTPAEQLVVVQLRLPRALVGALVGLALGLAGGLFQSVTRNPLGSPDVIGFTTGSATGGLVAILVVGGGAATTSTGAVLGGAGTAAAVLLLTLRHHGVTPLRLVLVGIGAGTMLQAVNSLLVVSSSLYDAQSASVWLVGNLAGRDWSRLELLGPAVGVGLVLALLLSRALTVGELADERSASLGLRPDRVRLAAMMLGVLLASVAVATAGPIAFISLSAPQIARRLTGTSGPNLLAGGLAGAVLLVLTDLAAREAFQPRQLPTGVLTGVVGGLYLIWLLTREWRRGRA